MNSSKTCIDKQISENKFIINLKEYKNIKEINLQYLLDQITANKHINILNSATFSYYYY